MDIPNEILKWLWTIPAIVAAKVISLVWTNHKSLQEIRLELAENYPTKRELQRCKEDTDKRLEDLVEPLKQGHSRIENKLDRLIQRELDRHG